MLNINSGNMRKVVIWASALIPAFGWAQSLSPEKLPHTGVVFFQREFEDKGGSNIVFASAVEHKEKISTDLHVYQYRLENGSAKLVWDIQDFGGNLCDMVLHEESVQILDLDGDGYRECSFIYQQRCDGLDPYMTKLMLHSQGKKYAIRGKIGVEDGKQLEKTIDATFSDAPAVFKRFANVEWDEFVANGAPVSQKSLYESANGWAVLAEEDLMASGGVSFSLLDQAGKNAPVPANIQAALKNATDVSVMPDKNAVMIISVKAGVWVYEPLSGKATSLMTFLGDTEALSMIEWSPSRKKVSFVSLNQAQYPKKTKIFVLTLDGYKVLAKDKYDAPVFYMAAADWVVYSASFEGENTLKFYTKAREGGEGPEETLKLD